MSAHALKLDAAKATRAWHLALDKYPFDLLRPQEVRLTRIEIAGNRQQEQPIKAARLAEIAERAADAARQEWPALMERQRTLLATLALQYGSRFRRVPLVNTSRILLHLGRASVIENVGLYCDRTTGLPVIPGTAVKGVISTWSCWEGNGHRAEFTFSRSKLGADLVSVLGANPADDHDASDQAGQVSFLGGFPVTAPGLELDIVTPHPQEGRGRITPNPFLAVKAGVRWDFILLASKRVPEKEIASLMDRAETWLRECLTQLGLGTKTSAGYGNFKALSQQDAEKDKAIFDALVDTLRRAKFEKELPEEERAYLNFVQSISDWALVARDIASKSDQDKAHILRFFRSAEGQAIIKGWPKSDKAKNRMKALKDAGL